MSRTLLIVGGGIETVPAVKLAQRMGLHVVVSDMSPQAPALLAADACLPASTYDVPATVAAAKEYHQQRPIDGVICVATDVPLTVASVAEALGLPGIPLESARLAMDKLAMKQRFAADGVAVPWFCQIESAAQLEELVRERGLPLVIKPVDSRGARGVLRLTETVDLDWAFAHARDNSPTGRVMIEEYLSGPQLSTESLVIDGVCHTPGFSDRNYELLERYAPHMIENGGDLPSFLPDAVQWQVKELIGRAAASMGIVDGVVKGDIVVTDGEPRVIELAARLSGGYFCSHEIPLNTGVDLVGCAIRQCLGERIDPAALQPRFQRAICQRYLFPEPGEVVSVCGAEQAEQLPGVELCEVRVRPGDKVTPINSHPARAGVLICSGETRRQALTRTEAAVSTIKILTRPV